MATTLQLRRGNAAEAAAFTGAQGELFIDVENKLVYLHDGTTVGGVRLAKESALALKANAADVTTALSSKQATLVSGTNIKTVNGTSILGTGNITISGGAGGGDLTQVSSDITPTFDGVYDIGSSTNRFYDAYLGNTLDINSATLSGSKTTIPGATVTNTSIGTSYSVPSLEPMAASMVSTPNSNFAIMISIPVGQTGVAPYSTLIAGIQSLVGDDKINITWTSNAGPGYTNLTRTLSNLTVTGWTTETNYTTSYTIYVQEDLAAIHSAYASAHPDVMAGQLRIMLSNEPIQLDKVITNVITLPATYDYTLASNASLVAPEVIADVALLGTNLIEADTITPEHVLGAYSDQRGTLIVDGSLKTNDDLNVRNKIALKQEAVEIGKVVSFGTAVGTTETTYASTVSWQSYFKDPYTMPGMGGNTFYAYPAYLYWSQTNLTSSATASSWAVGSTIKVTSGSYWWKFNITGVSFSGMGTQVDVTEIASSAPWSLYVQGSYGMSNFGQSGVASYPVDIALSSTGTVNTVELDNAAIPLVVGNKILVNGSTATTPVPTTLNLSGSLSSFSVQNTGGQPGYPNQRYIDISSDWNTVTNTNLVNIKTMFTNGNEVSIVYGGQIGVYTVSATSIISGMYGTNTRLNFTLTFFSGTDFLQNGTLGYAMGDMGQSVNWNSVIQVSTNYSSHIDSFGSAVNTAYQSSSSWSWLHVGDVLSYIPNGTSIQFSKDDGTTVKAITYNNNTGALVYDGIKSLIGDNAASTTLYSDTNVQSATKSASQATVYGYGAYAGNSAVAVGTNAGSGSSATNVTDYGNAFGVDSKASYQSIAIGTSSYSTQYSVALGNGSNISSGHSTGLGMNSYIGAGNDGITAWGGTGWNSTRHQIYTWTYHAAGLNSSNTWYIPTNPQYYSASTSPSNGMGVILNSILGYTDSLARIRMTAFIRKPSWAGADSTTWNIVTQEYVISNPSNDTYTLTAVGSPVTTASGGSTTWNNAHVPSLQITSVGGAQVLIGKLQKTNSDYVSVAIKVEMQSATWALN